MRRQLLSSPAAAHNGTDNTDGGGGVDLVVPTGTTTKWELVVRSVLFLGLLAARLKTEPTNQSRASRNDLKRPDQTRVEVSVLLGESRTAAGAVFIGDNLYYRAHREREGEGEILRDMQVYWPVSEWTFLFLSNHAICKRLKAINNTPCLLIGVCGSVLSQ